MLRTLPHPLPMPRSPGSLAELRRLAALSGPAFVTALAAAAMGMIDTIVVGRLGAGPLAAVALAASVYSTLMLLVTGLLGALTIEVAHAEGADERPRGGPLLASGVWLAALAALPVTLLCLDAGPFLALLGQDPVVGGHAAAYLHARAFGVIPAFVWIALRSFLYGLGRTAELGRVVLAANLLNLVLNLVLVFGLGPIPAMGLAGAGLATALSEIVLLAGTLQLLRASEFRDYGLGNLRIEPRLMGAALALGWPIAIQLFLESAIFAVLAVVAGWSGATALSAFQVLLSVVTLTFALPTGISVAVGARVGKALGRGSPKIAAEIADLGLVMTTIAAGAMGALLLAFPRPVAALFTDDPEVIAAAIPLLPLAAWFQGFDCLQVVASAALRAAGDSRAPLAIQVGGYWLVGLPVGYVLAIGTGAGVAGLWVGLGVAVSLIALGMVRAMQAKIPRAEAAVATAGHLPGTRLLRPMLALGPLPQLLELGGRSRERLVRPRSQNLDRIPEWTRGLEPPDSLGSAHRGRPAIRHPASFAPVRVRARHARAPRNVRHAPIPRPTPAHPAGPAPAHAARLGPRPIPQTAPAAPASRYRAGGSKHGTSASAA